MKTEATAGHDWRRLLKARVPQRTVEPMMMMMMMMKAVPR
jgi:hypothetical protein